MNTALFLAVPALICAYSVTGATLATIERANSPEPPRKYFVEVHYARSKSKALKLITKLRSREYYLENKHQENDGAFIARWENSLVLLIMRYRKLGGVYELNGPLRATN